MYSYEERIKAVQLYIQYDKSAASVIHELGYPAAPYHLERTPPMKYDNLSVFLNTEDKDTISLSFAQVESILGFSLPNSAYTYNAWWANGGHSQAAAWMNVGYQVAVVDLGMKSVVFKKRSEGGRARTGCRG